MDKAYEKIIFVNDTVPPLNDQTLNRMSNALDEIDNRVVELADKIQNGLNNITVNETEYEFTITIDGGGGD